jgi:hypothetical protein
MVAINGSRAAPDFRCPHELIALAGGGSANTRTYEATEARCWSLRATVARDLIMR